MTSIRERIEVKNAEKAQKSFLDLFSTCSPSLAAQCFGDSMVITDICNTERERERDEGSLQR